jgi:hypothetical protein
MKRRWLLLIILIGFISAPAFSQWLNHPSAGIPRTKDGKPDLSAPAPKQADGKPDLSGLWVADTSKYLGNLAADSDPVPFQPWAEKLYNDRKANLGKDDPEAQCMPQGAKVNAPHTCSRFFICRAKSIFMMFTCIGRSSLTTRALKHSPIPAGWGIRSGSGSATTSLSKPAELTRNFDGYQRYPHTEALA